MYSYLTNDIVVMAEPNEVEEKLEAGFWAVSFNDRLGFHFRRQNDMELPAKVYGHNSKITDKILSAFDSEVGRTTGVMLQGAKGTGKTLTATEVCIRAVERGQPVLSISSAFGGDDFIEFMNKITQPVVVFVDEFEKVYDSQKSLNNLLVLLDGAIKTHKLFVLTSNTNMEKENGMEFLTNRPSRIKYIFNYGTMEENVLLEYLDDNLKVEDYREDILAIRRSFKLFTIDILKAIVSEVNRYGKAGKKPTIGEILDDLNVNTDRPLSSYRYRKFLTVNGVRYPFEQYLTRNDLYSVSPAIIEQIFEGCPYFSITFQIPKQDIEIDLDLDNEVLSASKYDVTQLRSLAANEAVDAVAETILYHEKREELKSGGNVDSEKRKKFNEDVALGTTLDVEIRFDLIEAGEINLSQDNKSRALIVDCGSGVKLEFVPILEGAKKKVSYII